MVAGEDLARLRGEIGARLNHVSDGKSVGSGGAGADADGDAGASSDVGAMASDVGSLPIRGLEEAEALVLEKFSLNKIRRYAGLPGLLQGGLTEVESGVIAERNVALVAFALDRYAGFGPLAGLRDAFVNLNTPEAYKHMWRGGADRLH